MTEPRFQSFDEFWPFYLSQHRNPRDRHFHFVGTTGWLSACAASTMLNPIRFPVAMAGLAAALAAGNVKEKEGRPLPYVAAAMAAGTIGSPILFPAGVVFAYANAWIGHFGIEKNVPATFTYPVWSFLADIKMWTHMAKGELWSGDPLEELNLEVKEPGSSKAAVGVSQPVAQA